MALLKRLYRLGLKRPQMVPLLRFVDWVMSLPETMEQALWRAVQTMEEELGMAYLSHFERKSIEQGLEKGRQQGRLDGLQAGETRGIQEENDAVKQVKPCA